MCAALRDCPSVFVFQVPKDVSSLRTYPHPVKVGLSDAYYIDDITDGRKFVLMLASINSLRETSFVLCVNLEYECNFKSAQSNYNQTLTHTCKKHLKPYSQTRIQAWSLLMAPTDMPITSCGLLSISCQCRKHSIIVM